LFVIEDSLKYTKQDWRNRNRIRTKQGFAYLTVPVKRGAPSLPINEVEIDDSQPWRRRNWNLLRENYRNAPFWSTYKPFLSETFGRTWTRLIEIDVWFIEFLAGQFSISTPTTLLSELDVKFTADKTQSLVELVRTVGADIFLEGSAGREFIETERVEAAGLGIAFQDYVCRPYRQQFEPFISHLSAIDLLLNEGPGGSELI
jgi:hypothetical protein